MNFNWQDFDETKIDFHALTLCRKRSSSFQNFYSFYVRISTQNVFTFVKKSNRDFVFQSSCLTSHFTLFSSRTHSSVYFVPCNCHLSLFPFNSLYGFIICLLFFSSVIRLHSLHNVSPFCRCPKHSFDMVFSLSLLLDCFTFDLIWTMRFFFSDHCLFSLYIYRLYTLRLSPQSDLICFHSKLME